MRINHLGDWGTQFGKLIVAYKKWGSKEAVEQDGISELMSIYVKFHEEAEKDPSLNDEARAWFTKMEHGDKEALSIWKWFLDISLKEFMRVYDILGMEFDSYNGESFYNDKMPAVIEELKEKGLITVSEGAQIVDLEKYNMPPCLITQKRRKFPLCHKRYFRCHLPSEYLPLYKMSLCHWFRAETPFCTVV